jgi:hypothetical protein
MKDGKSHFKKGNYKMAAQAYKQALYLVPELVKDADRTGKYCVLRVH